MGEAKGQGYFAVRFITNGDTIKAVLTGKYYPSEPPIMVGIAKAEIKSKVKQALCTNDSPVYLVAGSAVLTALQALRSNAPMKVSDCHAGKRGAPCGKEDCAECQQAREDYFTHLLLHSIENPGPKRDDCLDAIQYAVMAVLGASKMNHTWAPEITDEEASRMISELKELGFVEKEGDDNGRE